MRKTLLGTAAVTWTVLITVLCLISMSHFSEFEGFPIPDKDKIVHFSFYFCFTILWYYFIRSFSAKQAKSIRWYVFFFAVSYGAFIEICQGVLPVQRDPDVKDALANAAGSAVAILLLWLLGRNKKQ